MNLEKRIEEKLESKVRRLKKKKKHNSKDIELKTKVKSELEKILKSVNNGEIIKSITDMKSQIAQNLGVSLRKVYYLISEDEGLKNLMQEIARKSQENKIKVIKIAIKKGISLNIPKWEIYNFLKKEEGIPVSNILFEEIWRKVVYEEKEKIGQSETIQQDAKNIDVYEFKAGDDNQNDTQYNIEKHNDENVNNLRKEEIKTNVSNWKELAEKLKAVPVKDWEKYLDELKRLTHSERRKAVMRALFSYESRDMVFQEPKKVRQIVRVLGIDPEEWRAIIDVFEVYLQKLEELKEQGEISEEKKKELKKNKMRVNIFHIKGVGEEDLDEIFGE